jgi:hypothetical protein
MTPQANFMVLAPILDGHVSALKDLLAQMNLSQSPGMADPNNSLVPFGKLENLHYARFVILDDATLSDFKEIGESVPDFPITLAFLGDCDGAADEFLLALVKLAAPGLEQIFSHCNYVPGSDLLAWTKQYARRPAAAYVNWIGRTVRQIREEAALRNVLVEYVNAHAAALKHAEPRRIREELIKQARTVKLTPAQETPFGWQLRNLLHFLIVPALLLLPWVLAIPFLTPPPKVFFPVVIPSLVLAALALFWLMRRTRPGFAILVALALLLVPFFVLFSWTLIPLVGAVVAFLLVLRWYEKSEREVIFPPSQSHDEQLAALEDHDVSNQFTALGSVKPSTFRRVMFVIILWFIDYGARHIYNRGYLSRIQSIHFARWVFLDDKRRVLFTSNYDGSRQAYMDDFINKAGWGLNLAFSNGLGYPRTRWLIKDGAKNELRFKDTNRRHQIPTQVWYKAYPGLTAFDLARNARIREGIERGAMTDAKIRSWLGDL